MQVVERGADLGLGGDNLGLGGELLEEAGERGEAAEIEPRCAEIGRRLRARLRELERVEPRLQLAERLERVTLDRAEQDGLLG